MEEKKLGYFKIPYILSKSLKDETTSTKGISSILRKETEYRTLAGKVK